VLATAARQRKERAGASRSIDGRTADSGLPSGSPGSSASLAVHSGGGRGRAPATRSSGTCSPTRQARSNSMGLPVATTALCGLCSPPYQQSPLYTAHKESLAPASIRFGSAVVLSPSNSASPGHATWWFTCQRSVDSQLRTQAIHGRLVQLPTVRFGPHGHATSGRNICFSTLDDLANLIIGTCPAAFPKWRTRLAVEGPTSVPVV
jgi:hypothetical protein